ncbi:MAG: thiamine import ATP-binding protein ThiQ [marine bacterium B5-7]|nr:MAG: thiamine import ATP-binding protein ThiQ [marine bacterium B5-7]
MLDINGLSCVLGNEGELTFEFDLRVERGEIVSIIGPSGSGKSTLLNLVGGFLVPDHGTILVDNIQIQTLPPGDRPVSTVFQEHNLFPHLSVADNVALGIHPGLKLDKYQHEQVNDALARVHLHGFNERKPGALSSGQRQRVSIARALVRERPVLLLDEPLSGLGPALRHELLTLLRELVEREFMAALLVSHHPEDTRVASTRTAFLTGGRIHAIADTHVLLEDLEDPLIREYLGRE